MRGYETTFVLDPNLEEQALTKEIQKVEETITKGGGEISKLERWGIKRFAHVLKKRRQGYYVHLRFSAPSELPKNLESFYELNEQVLRYLTVLSPPVKEPAPATPRTPPREEAESQKPAPEGETSTGRPVRGRQRGDGRR